MPSAPVIGDSVHATTSQPDGYERVGDLGSDTFPDRRVGDHAPPAADLGPTGLELRLDEQHHRGPRFAHALQRAGITIVSEMNDRSATTMSTGPPVTPTVMLRTFMRSTIVTAVVGADTLVELPVADVDGDNVTGAALQQAVGEPAGRCARIERQPTLDVDAERGQRVLELVAAATDEPRPAVPRRRAARRRRRVAPT